MTNLRSYYFSFALSLVFTMLTCLSQVAYSQEDETPTSASTSETSDVKSAFEGLLFSGKVPKTIEQLKFMESHFAKMSEEVFPATVNIQLGQSQGSGVVVSPDGYILTAAHVIGDKPGRTARITFLVDGEPKQIWAETLGVQPGRIDSGMLKIKEGKSRFTNINKKSRYEDVEEFPYVEIGTSQDLKLGQWVMAVGHPGGIDKSRGLVVRVGRIIDNRKTSLRTDCTLVGGDSGGPLFDMSGEVVGIHSRIGQTLADNLHVPADVYSEQWDLMAAKVVIGQTGKLGFGIEDDTNKVDKVDKNGPADEAGMKVGDFIVKVGTVDVTDSKSIKSAMKSQKVWPNHTLRVRVKRGEEEKALKIKVGFSSGN